MLYINNLTNDAFQQFNLTGISGVQIKVLLKYFARVQRWFMDITYTATINGQAVTQEINGISVINSPNILRKFRNNIPFGIGCTNIYKVDPYQLTDFQNQFANLYLLDSNDVQTIEENYFK